MKHLQLIRENFLRPHPVRYHALKNRQVSAASLEIHEQGKSLFVELLQVKAA